MPCPKILTNISEVSVASSTFAEVVQLIEQLIEQVQWIGDFAVLIPYTNNIKVLLTMNEQNRFVFTPLVLTGGLASPADAPRPRYSRGQATPESIQRLLNLAIQDGQKHLNKHLASIL